MTTTTSSSRLVDYAFAVWLFKSVFLSLFCELPICLDGPAWSENPHSNPVIGFVVDQIKDVDPMLMINGPDVRMTVCEHVVVLMPLYLLCGLALVYQWRETYRVTALLLCPAVLYGMLHYFVMELGGGPQPATNVTLFVVFNIDYVIVSALLFWRAVALDKSAGGKKEKSA